MNLRPLTAITGAEVWAPQPVPGLCTVSIRAGTITGLSNAPPHPAQQVLVAQDALLVPGLIDLQINGALGWSFQAKDRAHFDEIAAFHLARGTTTFLPTLITADENVLRNSLAVLADYARQAGPFTIPGIHLEGPFLSPERKGAHDPDYLRLPDPLLMERFLQAAGGMLRLFTLAPELPGAVELISGLVAQGVVVAGGHTAAAFADFQRAVRAGMTFLTHVGNASDWPHRALNDYGFMGSQPGLVGSLMALPQLGGSVILDGFHFHPALLKPLVELKAGQMVLISDASTVCGFPPGTYESGGLIATIHPAGHATSGRGGGWLAGSTITLLQGVQNAVQLAGLPLAAALPLATENPARLLGLEGQKGQIRPGADADLLVLNRDLSLRHVIVKGQLVAN